MPAAAWRRRRAAAPSPRGLTCDDRRHIGHICRGWRQLGAWQSPALRRSAPRPAPLGPPIRRRGQRAAVSYRRQRSRCSVDAVINMLTRELAARSLRTRKPQLLTAANGQGTLKRASLCGPGNLRREATRVSIRAPVAPTPLPRRYRAAPAPLKHKPGFEHRRLTDWQLPSRRLHGFEHWLLSRRSRAAQAQAWIRAPAADGWAAAHRRAAALAPIRALADGQLPSRRIDSRLTRLPGSAYC